MNFADGLRRMFRSSLEVGGKSEFKFVEAVQKVDIYKTVACFL